MTEGTWAPLKTVTANGLEFAYYELGEGPLVLCFHGYPDTADTWRDLLPALAEAGFRGVAPFIRGYTPTAQPADGDYGARALGADVLGLADALGGDGPVSLVGHDWGAFMVYTAVGMAPERFAKMVTLAIPHPRTLRPSLRAAWRARHFFTYQRRKAALRKLRKNDYDHVRQLWRRWSPNFAASEADLAPILDCFRKPGVAEAALGYYWSWRQDQRDPETRKLATGRISIPALALGGKADGALIPAYYDQSPRAYDGPYHYEVLDGLGHFPQREDIDGVNRRIVDFLGEPSP